MEEDTYLTTQYRDREAVKALGARWDAAQKSWYVPAGRDLAPFTNWLPAQLKQVAPSATLEVVVASAPGSREIATVPRGVTLSQLLAGVTQAVAQAYRAGVWTMVEVVDARLRSGHVYIEVSERDAGGGVAAKANAVIWANIAGRILPEFERATGAKVGPGIKLLLRMRPVFKAQYGFSLEIDAIDPEYTLGDLEAKKREIRSRLQKEGLFDANKKLPAPWDYTAVLVVAPPEGAGLGDFRAEAERLEQFGICTFVYAFSRFQGEGAAAEIRDVLLEALVTWNASEDSLPDAVVILRGGGAVNDLAWLNSYDLARCICELPVPVLTGIGHERDSTVLDEVAHNKFDTPSKVVLGIEQAIAKRTSDAKANFGLIARTVAHLALTARRSVDQADTAVKAGAQRNLGAARHRTESLMSEVRLGAVQSVRAAAEGAVAQLAQVSQAARHQISASKQVVPALYAEVRADARQAVRHARSEAASHRDAVLERSASLARHARENTGRALAEVANASRQVVVEAARSSEALMREIAGQGPEKTLARGFGIVRDAQGSPVTKVGQVAAGQPIQIQLRDGTVAANISIQGAP